MSLLSLPRKLSENDDRSTFCSGVQDLDEWLKRFALQNQKRNNAVTYVCTIDGKVVGYYALCAAAVGRDHVPQPFGRHRPNAIPCVLLARLAVDRRAQGKGLGRALLRDAILRSCQGAEVIGAACVLIHCRDEHAKQFYLSVFDFLQSPVEDLHLVLPIHSVRQALALMSVRTHIE